MVDELIAKLFDREVDRVLGPIPSEIRRTAEGFSGRGVVTSSRYIQAIFRLIVDGLLEVVLKRVEIEKQVWSNQAKKPKGEMVKRSRRPSLLRLSRLLQDSSGS